MRRALPYAAAGCLALVTGGLLSVGYAQFQARDAQLAEMTRLIESLQQAQRDEVATRAEMVSLLAVPPSAGPTEVVATPVVAQVAPAPAPQTAVTDVDLLRALVSRAVLRKTPARETIADAGAFETLALALQGVSDLAVVAGAGNYTLVAQDGSSTPSRIVFPDHTDQQSRTEELLTAAAVSGLIPYTPAAQRTDGSVDGGAILLSLIKDSL